MKVRKPVAVTTLSLVIALIGSLSQAARAGAQVLERNQQFYVVVAHPDDEPDGWSYLQYLPPSTYTVFITVTRGEGTTSCKTKEEATREAGSDVLAPTNIGTFLSRLSPGLPTAQGEISTGPFKYEGPDSPVGEPDLGERHPLGNPWVGQNTEACADARIASWHWFLDGQFRIDGIGTDLAVVNDPEEDDDYRGRFCPAGHQGQGQGRPVEKQIGCAQVWADDRGARVVYDLGDADFIHDVHHPSQFTTGQVTAALQTTRENRAKWGIPLLPETGVLSANPFGDGVSCDRANSFDHDVVNRAIRYHDQGLPLRVGRMYCETESLAEGADVRHIVENPASLVLRNLIDPATGTRVGPALVNYGWLFPDYVFWGCDVNCLFWEVRSPSG